MDAYATFAYANPNMSLKSTFFSGVIGTAGTTSIAIPSAGAYSNAYAESERQTLEEAKKEAESVNTTLKGINADLTKKKGDADTARDNAEEANTDTKLKLSQEQKKHGNLKEMKAAIIADKDKVSAQLSSLQSYRKQWEGERDSKLARVAELEKQNQELLKKQEEHNSKLQEAHRQMNEKVVNSIKEGLRDPVKLAEDEYYTAR